MKKRINLVSSEIGLGQSYRRRALGAGFFLLGLTLFVESVLYENKNLTQFFLSFNVLEEKSQNQILVEKPQVVPSSPPVVEAKLKEKLEEKSPIETSAEEAQSKKKSFFDPNWVRSLGFDRVRFREIDGGYEIAFSANKIFRLGRAELEREARYAISKLAKKIKKNSGSKVFVESHTDDSPVVRYRWKYRSNWELTGARAYNIIHLFESVGFSKGQLTAIGYGDSRPLVPNRNSQGDPIVSNRLTNRRVIIRVLHSDMKMSRFKKGVDSVERS